MSDLYQIGKDIGLLQAQIDQLSRAIQTLTSEKKCGCTKSLTKNVSTTDSMGSNEGGSFKSARQILGFENQEEIVSGFVSTSMLGYCYQSCPTCQHPCGYISGHAGQHQCTGNPTSHKWASTELEHSFASDNDGFDPNDNSYHVYCKACRECLYTSANVWTCSELGRKHELDKHGGASVVVCGNGACHKN